MVKRGLGRGLSSLIPSFAPGNEMQLEHISPGIIKPNPNQPRRQIDQEALEELVASIAKHGLIQPIVVQAKGNEYELIAGERRWRAAKEVGLKTIPALVRRPDNGQSLELALIENIQRENLSAIEEAQAYDHLIKEYNLTQAELATRIGKSRTALTNTLRLLQLPEELRLAILEGRLSPGHARAVLVLSSESDQVKLADKIVTEGLSVRQAESLVRLWQVAGIPKARLPLPKSYRSAAKKLRSFLGTRVKVKRVRNKNKVEIEFQDEFELERILNLVINQKQT